MAWAASTQTVVYSAPAAQDTVAEVMHDPYTGGDLTIPAVSFTGNTNLPYWRRFTFTLASGDAGATFDATSLTIPAGTVILAAAHKTSLAGATGSNSATFAYQLTGGSAFCVAHAPTTAYTGLPVVSTGGINFAATATNISITLATATIGSAGCTITLDLLCATIR